MHYSSINILQYSLYVSFKYFKFCMCSFLWSVFFLQIFWYTLHDVLVGLRQRIPEYEFEAHFHEICVARVRAPAHLSLAALFHGAHLQYADAAGGGGHGA